MIRQPDKPFPDNAATWHPRSKKLIVNTVHEVDPGIKSVAVNLSGGDINVRGLLPQVASAAPATLELTTQLHIRARNEEKAREILARQADKIKITASPDGVAVTQEADTTAKTKRELYFSRLRLLVDIWRGRDIDFALFGKNPKLDVSLQAPGQEILYELNTDYGDITVVGVRGKEGSAVVTRTGAVDVSHYHGDLTATSGYGDMHVSDHNGDLVVKTDVGEVNISEVEGNAQARSGYGNLLVNTINGNTEGYTDVGTVQVKNIVGNTSVKTGYGDIELENVTGDIAAATDVGNIGGIQLKGSIISARSGYGDINVATIKGGLDSSTDVGNIDVRRIEGSIQAKTGYGDVEVDNARLSGMSNRVTTDVGNIDVSVLNNSLIVHAVSQTGEFQTQGLQVDRHSGDDWRVDILAHLGSGVSKNRVDLVTGYGDIYVAKR